MDTSEADGSLIMAVWQAHAHSRARATLRSGPWSKAKASRKPQISSQTPPRDLQREWLQQSLCQ